MNIAVVRSMAYMLPQVGQKKNSQISSRLRELGSLDVVETFFISTILH